MNLTAQYEEPLQKAQKLRRLTASSLIGEKIVDFGQNVAGYAHTKALDQEGNFSNTTESHNEIKDVYILKGEGEEVSNRNSIRREQGR